MNILVALAITCAVANAHHFTSTTTGQVMPHFPSTKVMGNKTVRVYFKLQTPLAQGERLVARWTPPVVDGPCRVYEYTLPTGTKMDYVTRQRWNSAALSMFCPGMWKCEIIIRKQGNPDVKLHETRLFASRH